MALAISPDVLVDSSVLVDLFRRFPPSVEWLRRIRPKVIGIPVLVKMELLEGCRNRSEITLLNQELAEYPLLHLNESDSRLGIEWFEQFKLSHGLGIHDALIAAPAARLGLPLYTLNLKHFRPLPGVDARKPY